LYLINRFKEAIAGLYNTTFDKLVNVRDLQALLADPALETIHYPRSEQRRRDKNYEWFMNNKRANRRSDQRGPNVLLPYAEDDTEGLPYIQRRGRNMNVEW
ncbi:MAG: hypothetical protein ACPG7F_21830, partial [Aggregatilineales bacterium]